MKKNTLSFALIGAGKWGGHYIRLLQEIPDVFLKTIVVRFKESAQEIQKKYPSIHVETNVNKIWDDTDIDCVVIATPAFTHAQLAEQALKAGKHVLVEKPMTRTLEEAKKLRAFTRKSKKIFMVGYQYIYHDLVAALKRMAEQKEFGEIFWMNSEHVGSAYRKDVGVFLDAGVHALSLVKYLFGAEKIMSIAGDMEKKNGFDHFTSAFISFDSLLTSILCAREGDPKIRRTTIMGEKALAVFDDSGHPALLNIYASRWEKKEIPSVHAREPLRNELEHFIASVRTDKKPVTDIEFGYAIQEWADQILRTLDRIVE